MKIEKEIVSGITIGLDICSGEKPLQDEQLLERLLRYMAVEVGLRPLKSGMVSFPVPVIDESSGHGVGQTGLSMFIPLVESHASVHAWPEKGYARIELSSCKPIDWHKLVDLVDYCQFGRVIAVQTMDWFNFKKEVEK